jgi:hypothetical protein
MFHDQVPAAEIALCRIQALEGPLIHAESPVAGN